MIKREYIINDMFKINQINLHEKEALKIKEDDQKDLSEES